MVVGFYIEKHTAKVDHIGVGSVTLWAFETEALFGFLCVGLQACRPYGPVLAAVAVDSAVARLPDLASIPSKSRYVRVAPIYIIL